jgi:hypothetical protein
MVEELLHVLVGRLGIGVTTVAEEVDEDVGNGHFLGHGKQTEEVLDVRVNSAIGNQAEEMKTTVTIFGALEGLLDILDLVELAFLEGEVNSNHLYRQALVR